MLSNKRCKDFQSSPKMVENFTADNCYANAKGSSATTAENKEDEDLELFL